MKPLQRLITLIKGLNSLEKESLVKTLRVFNSNFGQKNKYLEFIESIEKRTHEDTPSDAERKRIERLIEKTYLTLAQDFNVSRKNTYSKYERTKIQIQKDLLFAQIAASRNSILDYEYFLQKALKASYRIEHFRSLKNILQQLIGHYSYRKNSFLEKQYRSFMQSLQEVIVQYETNNRFLISNETFKCNQLDDKNEQSYMQLLKAYRKGSNFKRIRRQQLYCFLKIQEDLGVSYSSSLKECYYAVEELINLIKTDPHFFTAKELPIAQLNMSIILMLSGRVHKSLELARSLLSKLIKTPYYYYEVVKHLSRLQLYSGIDNLQEGIITITTDNEEISFLHVGIKVVSGNSYLKDLSLINKLRSNNKEFDFFIQVYTILGFINNKDFDFADNLILRTLRLSKVLHNDTSKSLIAKTLKAWAKKGFQGEIQDLPDEFIVPLKEHYETQWNPLSADIIPLHLWNKTKGLPNHKEVYAHLFELKRKKSIEQGFVLE